MTQREHKGPGLDFGKLILDETPDAVVVTTPAGVVLYWNRAAHTMFGYAPEEALERNLRELIVPAQLPEADADAWDAALADSGSSQVAIRRARNGDLVYVDSSTRAVRGGEDSVAYLLWSMKDVTAQKVARDSAMASERFGALLELMPDAIVMANAVGRIVLANHQADDLFGYPRNGLRGQLLEVLLPERYRGKHIGQRAGYALRPQLRPMGAGRELFGLRAGGEEFPVEISLSPVRTEDGVLVMSAIRDISDRKRIEHALHEKNIELADANLAKDRFLSSMSHELRTPLNAIIGFTGTLLMQLPGPVNAQQEHQLRTIQSSARHLLSLINDILDITKIVSGKVELTSDRFDCCALVDDVVAMFAPLAQQKGLQLEARRCADQLGVCTDRRAVQQIVINLINNAIKFTETGGVTVHSWLDRDSGGGEAVIDVIDTGIGIAADKLDLLFTPFTQLDQGNTRQFEGTGLGLHLSKRLAELIGGSIGVRSRQEAGSIFTLRLPLCAA